MLHKVTQNYGMVIQSRNGAVNHMVSQEMSDDITSVVIGTGHVHGRDMSGTRPRILAMSGTLGHFIYIFFNFFIYKNKNLFFILLKWKL